MFAEASIIQSLINFRAPTSVDIGMSLLFNILKAASICLFIVVGEEDVRELIFCQFFLHVQPTVMFNKLSQ